MFNRA